MHASPLSTETKNETHISLKEFIQVLTWRKVEISKHVGIMVQSIFSKLKRPLTFVLDFKSLVYP